jgi:hypothetical protein
MKPQRFEIGQAVTRKIVPWASLTSNVRPKAGEIYHVSGYVHSKMLKFGNPYPGWYITFDEHGKNVFHREKDFDPVISTHELESLLSEVPITETVPA